MKYFRGFWSIWGDLQKPTSSARFFQKAYSFYVQILKWSLRQFLCNLSANPGTSTKKISPAYSLLLWHTRTKPMSDSGAHAQIWSMTSVLIIGLWHAQVGVRAGGAALNSGTRQKHKKLFTLGKSLLENRAGWGMVEVVSVLPAPYAAATTWPVSPQQKLLMLKQCGVPTPDCWCCDMGPLLSQHGLPRWASSGNPS